MDSTFVDGLYFYLRCFLSEIRASWIRISFMGRNSNNKKRRNFFIEHSNSIVCKHANGTIVWKCTHSGKCVNNEDFFNGINDARIREMNKLSIQLEPQELDEKQKIISYKKERTIFITSNDKFLRNWRRS